MNFCKSEVKFKFKLLLNTNTDAVTAEVHLQKPGREHYGPISPTSLLTVGTQMVWPVVMDTCVQQSFKDVWIWAKKEKRQCSMTPLAQSWGQN